MRQVTQRAFGDVPRPVLVLLAGALALQLALALTREARVPEARPLPGAPPAALLEVAAAGEPGVLARILMLWLQSFDYQPGVSVPFARLDYARLEDWLERVLALDPGFQYPLLAASRLYAEVPDAARQRRMLAFVARQFDADPAARWPWLAHAVYVAKHRLGDLRYALELATRLARAPDDAPVPGWARQMHVFVLEDLGELESARVLLGGLLESGRIADPHERRFLGERLAELERRAAQSSASSGGAAEE